MKLVSFCITCMGRLEQLKLTLPQNLSQNITFKDKIEFVVVDLGGNDGLQDWLGEHFKDELSCGYLYFENIDYVTQWHASIAKNISHSYGTGKILVNLDCDNFTGKNGGMYVIKKFLQYGDKLLFHQFGGDGLDGSFGRIAMTREHFYKVGGYDESLLPMGYQDQDLINRLKAHGLNYIRDSNKLFNKAIRNTKEEGLKNTSTCLSYINMLEINRLISHQNILDGKILANNGSIKAKR